MAQQVKNPPAMKETQEARVLPLSQKDPLEKKIATHSNTLAWKIPWTEGYSPKGHKELHMTEQLSRSTVPKFDDKLYPFYLLNVILYQVIFHFSMKYI